jgi:GNAT superfamily N-acetyltransferase
MRSCRRCSKNSIARIATVRLGYSRNQTVILARLNGSTRYSPITTRRFSSLMLERVSASLPVHLRDAPSFEMFIRQRHAVIDDLIVHPDWRRRGIARRLYQACEEWALERKASWVEVTVYDFNAEAYDFYASVGFGTTMRRMQKPLAG